MEFDIQNLSFYVVTVEGKGEMATKHYRHFQTLDKREYEENHLRHFLDGELAKVASRRDGAETTREGIDSRMAPGVRAGRDVLSPDD